MATKRILTASLYSSTGGPASKIEPAQITADQNNYTAGGLLSNNVDSMALDLDAAWSITGFDSTGILDGKEITIINSSSFTLTLTHQDASSSVGNRIDIPGAVNLALDQRDSVRLLRDSTLNTWRVV